ncbi:hypothetical protein OOK31_25370 [Streptomyces sp. NBC_00249]|uniref:hypothetical protein n=1 Tax=Streptomyces sp. NBC_00249 TaxID=2975690 RepID=UPI00225024B8|nr:hypothetical protein [Streptomyces sp. NBC_00249]MCX5197187.1 hypothetical protein [Streptomyces sp. NBC_00249]
MFGSKSREIRDLQRALRISEQRFTTARTNGRDALHAADGAANRLTRALRACARYRADLAVQRRVTRRLADQLLDATGSRGHYLIPEERAVLGIKDGDAA